MDHPPSTATYLRNLCAPRDLRGIVSAIRWVKSVTGPQKYMRAVSFLAYADDTHFWSLWRCPSHVSCCRYFSHPLVRMQSSCRQLLLARERDGWATRCLFAFVQNFALITNCSVKHD